jgi:hypothetical protein
MEDLSIEKAAIYRDGRTNCVFSDQSAMILHPGGQFLTYFPRNGQPLRQVTSCVTCVEDAKEKAFLLIELHNSIALHPISVLAEQLYAREIKLKQRSKQTCVWAAPALSVVIDSRSGEQVASVAFEQETARGTVEIQLAADGALNLQSIDQMATVSLSADGLLLKVTFPMFLSEKKVVTKGETYRGLVGADIAYQTVELTQIFSTADYPEEWSRPLELLWHCFQAIGRTEIRSPAFYFPAETPEDIVGEFRTRLPSPQQGDTWKSDSISPAVSLFNYYESPIFAAWSAEATLRNVPNLGIEGVIHCDQARLLCAEGGFFHYFQPGGEVRSFSKDSVPVVIRSQRGNYSLEKVVEMCLTITSQPSAAPKVLAQPDLPDDPEGIKCENNIENVGTFTAYNDGSMRALFDDRTVIRINTDLSVSVLSRKGEQLKLNLDNPYGFEAYIPVCLEFYEWAFSTPEEKARKQVKEAELQLRCQVEVEKIDRLLGLEPRESYEE